VRAIVFGCAGPRLSGEERAFFRDADPFGFILFARNIEHPGQVRRLIDELRDSVGRAAAPILVDQEGGRVQRLRPPHWQVRPPAAAFGRLAERDLLAATEAAWLNGRLIAAELQPLGFSVDCAPCLDLALPATHAVIGTRAFAGDPAVVARLGRAFAEGLLAGGVLPVVKHLPGHGRAQVDSHLSLPLVGESVEELAATDFAPFAALADLPAGMSAHVLFQAIDPERPASISPLVIGGTIRRLIGFRGLLFSDDLGMHALSGSIGERAARALAAGTDVALHCSGEMAEMRDAAASVGPLAGESLARADAALAAIGTPQPFDAPASLDRLLLFLKTS